MNEIIYEHQFVASCVLVLVVTCIRWLVVRHLKKVKTDDADLPRRWINSTRNTMTAVIVLGLIMIWFAELRFLALSIATFTVAIILALRELIQCFLGGVYQTSNRAFSIGDWVQIGNHYGEVASSDWLTTKLLEIDIKYASYVYTGKTIVVPNNQFITSPIYNLNFMRRYVVHTFSIVRDPLPVDTQALVQFLLQRAHVYCESFGDVAHRYGSLLEKRLGVPLPGPEPKVRVTTTELGKNCYMITLFCPTHEAVKLEQLLTQDFLAFWHKETLPWTSKLYQQDVEAAALSTKA